MAPQDGLDGVYMFVLQPRFFGQTKMFLGDLKPLGTPKSISGCFPGRGIQSAEPLKFPSRRVTLPILDLKDVVGLCLSTL